MQEIIKQESGHLSESQRKQLKFYYEFRKFSLEFLSFSKVLFFLLNKSGKQLNKTCDKKECICMHL